MCRIDRPRTEQRHRLHLWSEGVPVRAAKVGKGTVVSNAGVLDLGLGSGCLWR